MHQRMGYTALGQPKIETAPLTAVPLFFNGKDALQAIKEINYKGKIESLTSS